MKKYNNIDELFRDNISDYELKPSRHVWTKIQNHLAGSSNNVAKKTLLLSLLMFITTGLTVVLYINPFSTGQDTNSGKNLNTKHIINNKKDIVSSINSYRNQETKSVERPHNNKEEIKNDIIEESIQSPEPNNGILQPYTVSTNSSLKTSNNSHNPKTYNFGNIQKLIAKNYYLNFDDPLYKPQDRRIIDINTYTEKKRKFHAYTGTSVSLGMMYYQNTPDMYTWSADIFAGYKLSKVYIETGIGFQQIKEHGLFRIDFERNDSVGYYQKVTSFEINPNNPDEITYNLKTTTVYDSVAHHIFQSPVYSYNYINVPIKIGYRFLNTDKLILSSEAGLIFGFLSDITKPKINYYDPESKLISITDNTPVRANNTIRLQLSLRASYMVSRTLSVNIQPEFGSYLQSVYSNENLSGNRPYTASLRFSILFNF